MNQRDYNIVVGLDFSPLADRAFAKAYELGGARERAVVHVVHVVAAAGGDVPSLFWGEHAKQDPTGDAEQIATQLHRRVQALFAKLRCAPTGSVRIVSHVRFGEAGTAIASLASELEADMIVLGAQGRFSFSRWLLGSVAQGVIRYARSPVLVVPPDSMDLSVPEFEPKTRPDRIRTRRMRSSFPAEAATH